MYITISKKYSGFLWDSKNACIYITLDIKYQTLNIFQAAGFFFLTSIQEVWNQDFSYNVYVTNV